MKRGQCWPLHFVYDSQDFINGKAPGCAWDEINKFEMAIYSLNQTEDLWP